MKKILLVLFVTIPFYSSAQNKDVQEILGVMENQTSSWNKGDLDHFMIGYWNNDSLMFIGSNGITYGYKQALQHYKDTYGDNSKMGKLNFELVRLKKISGDYYFMTGKWFLTRSAGDIGGVFTLLFRKIQGHWLIVVDHSS